MGFELEVLIIYVSIYTIYLSAVDDSAIFSKPCQ